MQQLELVVKNVFWGIPFEGAGVGGQKLLISKLSAWVGKIPS